MEALEGNGCSCAFKHRHIQRSSHSLREGRQVSAGIETFSVALWLVVGMCLAVVVKLNTITYYAAVRFYRCMHKGRLVVSGIEALSGERLCQHQHIQRSGQCMRERRPMASDIEIFGEDWDCSGECMRNGRFVVSGSEAISGDGVFCSGGNKQHHIHRSSQCMREGRPLASGLEAFGASGFSSLVSDGFCSVEFECHHIQLSSHFVLSGFEASCGDGVCPGGEEHHHIQGSSQDKRREKKKRGKLRKGDDGMADEVGVVTPSHTTQQSEHAETPGFGGGVWVTPSRTAQQTEDVRVLQTLLKLSWPEAVKLWQTRLRP